MASNPLQMIRTTNPILRIANSTFIDLPSPSNLSIWWNFGSLLGLCLVLQILTGLVLATRYTAHSSLAFDSVVSIMQDTNYGWLFRLLHSTGASFFFLFLYCHIGRGIYYGSYLNPAAWNIGVTLFLLVIATSFLGYILPWGQMSYWAATVITNLISAIPYLGATLVVWVWGDFSVSNPTLTRFYALHFLLPFIIAFLSGLHLFYLHQHGSSNPTGLNSNSLKVHFHPYYTIKDGFYFIVFLWLFLLVSLQYGYRLIDPDNFVPANPLVTPSHIKPEWYFLFAYAILRSIPTKLGGVVAFLASVLILYLFPLISPASTPLHYNPVSKLIFAWLVATWILLSYIGAQPAQAPFIVLSQLATGAYFTLFLALFSSLTWSK